MAEKEDDASALVPHPHSLRGPGLDTTGGYFGLGRLYQDSKSCGRLEILKDGSLER